MSTSSYQFYKFSRPIGWGEIETSIDPILSIKLPTLPKQAKSELYIFYPFCVKKEYLFGDEIQTTRDLFLFARAKYAQLYSDEEKFFLANLPNEFCGKCRDFSALKTTTAVRRGDCAVCIKEEKKQGAEVCLHGCAICQGEDAPQELLLRTACGHDYHPSCLSRWFVLRNSCPLCRLPLVPCSCGGARVKQAVFTEFSLPIMNGAGPHGLYLLHMNELFFSGIARSRNVYWLVGAE